MFKISTNKAFTLIEVLVVTAVIALLASVVFASLSEARTEAEIKIKYKRQIK
jgi:prepilin-type N-terminal cleavage/methylation domain-containing protein